MATKSIFLTTTGTGTYIVPSDFGSLVSVEAIGGGGNGAIVNPGGGGGGGAYAKSITMTGLAAGSTVYYQVGIGGGTVTSGTGTAHSWFSLTNANPTVNLSIGNTGVLACGGTTVTTGTGAAGGTVALSTGDTRYAGGTGGTSTTTPRGGGGGAGGPGGAGGNGGAGYTVAAQGAGAGGSGATLSAAGTIGGTGTATVGGAGGASAGQTGGSAGTNSLAANNTAPTNGGGGGGAFASVSSGGAGSAGIYWTQTSNSATAGSGGGGGGASTGTGATGAGGAGGLYGGGGASGTGTGSAGAGAQGIIVFTYQPKATTQFSSREGDLEQLFVTDYAMIDQYASTGSMWTWGGTVFGQLGDNTAVSKSSPVQTVSGGTNWKLVASGKYHIAAIKTDGTLWLWGRASDGRLGDNTAVSKSSPVQTVSGGTNWKQVSAGVWNTAAIKTDGTLWLWGHNTYGGLGDNTAVSKSSPVQTVSGGTNWKLVAAGGYHIAAIKTDGTLWTWGFNTWGALGDNTVVQKSSPVQTVSGGTNWKLVAGGRYNTAAIKTDGTLWTWGHNTNGRLGDNTIVHRSSPVQTVSGGTNWKLVSGGYYHTAAIKTDGTLWSWGHNTYGGLGDNTIVHRSSPVQTVTGGTNWKSVYVCAGFAAAVKTDGTLWLWGANGIGNLGDNTVASKSSPIQTVSGGTNWKSVAGGFNHTAAIFFYEAGKLYPPS